MVVSEGLSPQPAATNPPTKPIMTSKATSDRFIVPSPFLHLSYAFEPHPVNQVCIVNLGWVRKHVSSLEFQG